MKTKCTTVLVELQAIRPTRNCASSSQQAGAQ